MLEVIKQRMRKVEFKTECRFVVINNRMSFYPRHQQQNVILPSSSTTECHFTLVVINNRM
jgi:hypothetical protein